MLQQQTIGGAAAFSGVGLHSGNRVNMKFLPASGSSGIRFRRMDLDGRPEVEAHVDNVGDTTRSTTLAKGNIRIHTVEHILAAFSGKGVDSAIVELDANEPPIADGSSREYGRMIDEAGIVPLPEKKEPYRISAPIEFHSGDTFMSFFPGDTFKVSCTSQDNDGRFTQFYSVEINPQTWEKELAHARTFCFFEEIEFLIKNGLIKGGSLENAIVVRDDAVLTTEPLRYSEEFVRHKILDIVGDLALVGRPLQGHLVAIRPSHSANCEMSRQVVAQMRKPLVVAQTFAPPPPPSQNAPATGSAPNHAGIGDEATFDIKQIMKILPHRQPFLMVDKVTRIDGNKITGVKSVSINEHFFEGHFPGHPIMPGVLQLEAMAQVAGILMLKQLENAGKIAYFMSAERVKWRRPVVPGDALVIDVELTKVRGKLGRAKGVCSVDGETVSEAEVTFMLIDQ